MFKKEEMGKYLLLEIERLWSLRIQNGNKGNTYQTLINY